MAFLPVGIEPDYRYWNARMRFDAEDRQAARGRLDRGVAVGETEPNNSIGTADPVPGFGTGGGDSPSATINADVEAPPPATNISPAPEDEGSIPLATNTALTPGNAVSLDAVLGDGPFGSAGTGSGDFDFYRVTATGAGQSLVVDLTRQNQTLDSFIAIYDAAGTIVAFNDDEPGSLDSFINFEVPAAGDYYASIGTFSAPILNDPFDSSSGPGSGSEGPYNLVIGLDYGDNDFFALELSAGDVLGVGTTGAAPGVSILDPAGVNRMTSSQDATFIFPADSPLMGSGGALATLVAGETGTHYLRVQGSLAGSYTLELDVYRPATETLGRQILFIDFDGANIDPAIFGGPVGVVSLSPLSSFLSGWGLSPGDEDAVIDAILASVVETVDSDLATSANNSFFDVEILNSRDHADPFGQPNVSRLIVGGTIAELGISTIGIAQSIDPGNFDVTESAVILLDLLSAPSNDPNSLNSFPLAGGATIFDIVGTGVGNITSHEAGHYLGNFHTEQFTTPPNIMDQGGNLGNSVGVGNNGVFGDGDDIDVDLIEDMFVPSEGFAGTEDCRNVTAFGLSSEFLFNDGFESGDTSAWANTVP